MARPSTGAGLAIADLQRMLDQRQSDVKRLYKKRTEIERELAAVDREIEKLTGKGGGRGGRRGGGRARNETSLVDTLEGVLRDNGAPMGIADIVEAVLATGYRSNSDNFRGIINQQLIKERKRFHKPSRGMYQVKAAGGKKKAEGAAA